MSAEAPVVAAPGHVVSTGRGGAGNVGVDTTEYTDGGIVHEGIQGESAAGEYSSGRGGAGNIGGVKGEGVAEDKVPAESQIKPQDDFHTGRGGGGNVHKEKYGGHTSDPNKPSLLSKIKAILSGKKKSKPAAETPATTTNTPAA